MTTNLPAALPPATPDPALEVDARALHGVLGELMRVVQFRDRDRICCHDLSVTGCYALEAVIAGGPLTLNELAVALLLDKSTASRVVDALERKGYVLRRPHPDDGRAVQLEATAAGRELYGRIEDDLVGEVRHLLAGLEPPARRATIQVLRGLLRAAFARVERSAGCCRMR